MTVSAARDFGFGPEEQLLRDQARKFLDEHASLERLRKFAGADPEAVYVGGSLPGYDREAWQKVVALGWPALAVPEEQGGPGLCTAGVVALLEEVGRRAFPSPLVSSLIASYVLRHVDSPEARRWLGELAEGAAASLASTDAAGSWELGDCDVRATEVADGWRLEGVAAYVQDAHKAEFFVVSVRGAGGLGLCVVPADAKGVALERDHIVDLTRDQARLHLSGVEVAAEQIVARAGVGRDALEAALPTHLALVAADLVGGSEWMLQTTVEYAKTRTQFERPLGFFQAVKHPLVDAMMAIDRARSHLYQAAACIDFEPDRALVAARMAKSQASDAAAFMASRAVQLHGGIGFTWESDVHFYFKRALHNEALYGDGAYQRAKLADVLIGPSPG